MSLVRQAKPPASERRVLWAVAWIVPFLGYLLTTSSHGYWLDAGEFVAAGTTLGITHPPGHPLMSLITRCVALLPLGPLAWRTALASAICAATAVAVLFAAVDTTVRCLGVQRNAVAYPIAFGTAFFVAGTHAFWFQAVRPEVYALQAALVLFAVERVIWLEANWPTRDMRPLYMAAFAWGLGLANHHLIAALALPAAFPTLARAQRAHGARVLAGCAAAVLLGMATYIYLPLRAANSPLPNLGDPTSLQRTLWVISAQVYRGGAAAALPQPWGERVADVIVTLVEQVHILCLLALGGWYALLRAPGARRVGSVWAWLACVALLGRAWLGFVRGNPDAEGYLMPAFAAVGALASGFVAVLLGPEHGLDRTRTRLSTVAVAWVVAALGLAQLHRGFTQHDLSTFHATDDYDDALQQALDTRALVIAHRPQTVFRWWSLLVEQGARPDCTLVPVPFLNYPGAIEALLQAAPELQGLLRDLRLYDSLREGELQSLTARRPVFVELDVRVPSSVYSTLAPAGMYYEVLPGGATDADVEMRAIEQAERYRQLYRRLGSQRYEPATRDQLLWHHYNDGLYFMALGILGSAREAVGLGLQLAPWAHPLPEMKRALETQPVEGQALDVEPFRIGTR